MKNHNQVQRIAIMGMLIALIVIMTFTNIGYILLVPFSMTTIHIPVIIGAAYFGRKEGTLLGLVFGLSSFMFAVTHSGLPEAVLYLNPIISVLPRVLVGLVVGLLADGLRKVNLKPALKYILLAITGTLTNTVLVLSAIWIFYSALVEGILKTTIDLGEQFNFSLLAFVVPILSINVLLEVLFSALVVPPVLIALNKVIKNPAS